MEKTREVIRRASLIIGLSAGAVALTACNPFAGHEIPPIDVPGVPVSTQTAAPADSASRPEATLKASQAAVNQHMAQFNPDRA